MHSSLTTVKDLEDLEGKHSLNIVDNCIGMAYFTRKCDWGLLFSKFNCLMLLTDEKSSLPGLFDGFSTVYSLNKQRIKPGKVWSLCLVCVKYSIGTWWINYGLLLGTVRNVSGLQQAEEIEELLETGSSTRTKRTIHLKGLRLFACCNKAENICLYGAAGM